LDDARATLPNNVNVSATISAMIISYAWLNCNTEGINVKLPVVDNPKRL